MARRSTTTKDIALLYHLYKNDQLTLAPEFQRNAIWPNVAKAYLIDTILHDRPIPLLFFQRVTSAQSGLPTYTVIDGQQRLRAIFDFLDDEFRLARKTQRVFAGKFYSDLRAEHQLQIKNYDLIVEELSGYSERDIRDMFVRINRYLVQLSPQELRHAQGHGKFHEFVERFGKLSFWKEHKVFSKNSLKRMKAVEFSAELSILIIEGPQDKKSSIDLYYGQYQRSFPESKKLADEIESYLAWIARALPELSKTRFRKPVDLYALLGALDRLAKGRNRLAKLDAQRSGNNLRSFEARMAVKQPTGQAARYLVAASRQTDNLIPRKTRIEILEKILRD